MAIRSWENAAAGHIPAMFPLRGSCRFNIDQRDMVTAFAAGNIFIVLPILIERNKELYRTYDLSNEDTERMPDIIIPVVFSFPNLGKLLIIVFVLFAVWFAGSDIDLPTHVSIATNGLVSLFCSVCLTEPVLPNELQLPADLFQ